MGVMAWLVNANKVKTVQIISRFMLVFFSFFVDYCIRRILFHPTRLVYLFFGIIDFLEFFFSSFPYILA